MGVRGAQHVPAARGRHRGGGEGTSRAGVVGIAPRSPFGVSWPRDPSGTVSGGGAGMPCTCRVQVQLCQAGGCFPGLPPHAALARLRVVLQGLCGEHRVRAPGAGAPPPQGTQPGPCRATGISIIRQSPASAGTDHVPAGMGTPSHPDPPPAPHRQPGKGLRVGFTGSGRPGWWRRHPGRPRPGCSLPASRGWSEGQPRPVPCGASGRAGAHAMSTGCTPGKRCPRAPRCPGASSVPGEMWDGEASQGAHAHAHRDEATARTWRQAEPRQPNREAAGNWAVKPQLASGDAATAAADAGGLAGHPGWGVTPPSSH